MCSHYTLGGHVLTLHIRGHVFTLHIRRSCVLHIRVSVLYTLGGHGDMGTQANHLGFTISSYDYIV